MTERHTRSRHGLNALKARVKVRGLQALDQRTVAAQALLGWRRDLIADLGREAAMSAQRHSGRGRRPRSALRRQSRRSDRTRP